LGLISSVLSGINSRPGLRRIVTNAGWLFADRLLSLVAGFLLGAWVARYLGPARYGLYSYALAFAAVFAPLAGLGLSSVLVREIVAVPTDKDTILGTALALQFGASLVAFALVVTMLPLIRRGDVLMRWLTAVAAGQFAFSALGGTVDCWFRSQVQSKYTVWSNNIALVLAALIRVALILLKAPLIAFVWATLAQTVASAISAVVLYRVSGQAISAWRSSVRCASQLLRDSWPLILSSLAVVVYMKIGQLMLGEMLGDEDVGVYSVAVRLSEIWYFVPTAVAASVFPAIVRSRENQTEQVYRGRLQAFYDAMAGIAYLIVIPCSFLASPLVTLLFGQDYAAAGPILAVHIWAFVFVSLGVARSQWLIAENLTRFSMLATVLGAGISIGLNYLFIPRYAGLGAAWATLISYAVSAYLSSLLSTRTRPVFAQLSLSLAVPFRFRSFWRALREIR
jgi:PST family polysaccharide transporter